jgi:endonuclease-3
MDGERKMLEKQPFDIAVAMSRIREVMRRFPKAAMFELADEGYRSPFEQLVACMISIRTRDETTLPVARHLFEHARTPDEVRRLTPSELEKLIERSTFHEAKARQIHAIACRVVQEYRGSLPCDADVLLSFPGVGPKCANLVLGIACDRPRISVDIHVHRVTNRWGYVCTRTPEATMTALEAKLPRQNWVEVNELLMPFGKYICTGNLPQCSKCPMLDRCQQVGVEAHR